MIPIRFLELFYTLIQFKICKGILFDLVDQEIQDVH